MELSPSYSMKKRRFASDGSLAILRHQVYEKRVDESVYHRAFDTERAAKKYVKSQKGKFNIKKAYI